MRPLAGWRGRCDTAFGLMNEPAITFDHDRVGIRVPARALTHAGFRAWVVSPDCSEKLRASWIEGEILIDTSP